MNSKAFEQNRKGKPVRNISHSRQPNDRASSSRETLIGLLTRNEVAERAQICVHTVARYTKRGLLPAVMFGPRLIRYRPQDVEKFIQSAMVGGLYE